MKKGSNPPPPGVHNKPSPPPAPPEKHTEILRCETCGHLGGHEEHCWLWFPPQVTPEPKPTPVPEQIIVRWHCNTCRHYGNVRIDSLLPYYEVLKTIQAFHLSESPVCSAVAEIGR